MSNGLYMPAPGVGNVGSYQVSGRPYVTGGIIPVTDDNVDGVVVEFPYITKAFIVGNEDPSGSFIVHFASRTDTNVLSGSHYLTLYPGTALSPWGFVNMKVKRLYLSVPPGSSDTASFFVFAELTNIKEDYILSGSGISDPY